jgi:hypothetical protein
VPVKLLAEWPPRPAAEPVGEPLDDGLGQRAGDHVHVPGRRPERGVGAHRIVAGLGVDHLLERHDVVLDEIGHGALGQVRVRGLQERPAAR